MTSACMAGARKRPAPKPDPAQAIRTRSGMVSPSPRKNIAPPPVMPMPKLASQAGRLPNRRAAATHSGRQRSPEPKEAVRKMERQGGGVAGGGTYGLEKGISVPGIAAVQAAST